MHEDDGISLTYAMGRLQPLDVHLPREDMAASAIICIVAPNVEELPRVGNFMRTLDELGSDRE